MNLVISFLWIRYFGGGPIGCCDQLNIIIYDCMSNIIEKLIEMKWMFIIRWPILYQRFCTRRCFCRTWVQGGVGESCQSLSLRAVWSWCSRILPCNWGCCFRRCCLGWDLGGTRVLCRHRCKGRRWRTHCQDCCLWLRSWCSRRTLHSRLCMASRFCS